MKQKIIIISAIASLLLLVAFMVKDFFFSKPDNSNPYKFELDNLRTGDTAKAAYAETMQIKTTLEEIHGIALAASGRIYIAGKSGIEIFNPSGKAENKFKIEGIAQCISIDEIGNLILGMQDHIEIRDNSGKQIEKWNSFVKDLQSNYNQHIVLSKI